MYKQVINLWKLRILSRIPFARPFIRLANGHSSSESGIEVFNLEFKNRIGLGPGVDKDGQFFNILSDYGFSFTDLGPVNSTNVKAVIRRLQSKSSDTLISLCINRDHARTFSLSYDFADFFDFDIPDDDIIDVLDDILDIRLTYDKYKPVLLRFSHELPRHDFENVLGFCMLNGVDGIIAATPATVKRIHDFTGSRLPVIGYGGIDTPEKAREFIESGASLIEATSGLESTGPSIAGKILKLIGTE